MTTVSGIIRDTQGNALPGLAVTIRYTRPLVGFDGGAAVQNVRSFTTSGTGLLTMPDLVPGHYDFFVSVQVNASTSATLLQKGTITVLAEGPMSLEESLDQNIGPVDSSILQQAIAAKDAAETARDSALSAYQGRQYVTPAAFRADTAYVNGANVPQNGTVVTAGDSFVKVDSPDDELGDLPGWLPFGAWHSGQFSSSAQFASAVRSKAADIVANGTLLNLRSGDTIAVPCNPTTQSLREFMEWASKSHSVPTGARLYIELADGLHFVSDVIEVSTGATVEIDATAAPFSLDIESIVYTDAGGGLWDARITVSGGTIPSYVTTGAGAVVGVQNPVGNGTPDAVAQGLIVTTRHSATEFTCRFRPQGVLPLVDMTTPTAGVSLGITQNKLIIPRACIRADGANPDWTPGGVGNREGFINTFRGSRVIWSRLSLTKSEPVDARELLFARDQGSNFAIREAVVVGDCHIVVRSAYGGDYLIERSFLGCGTTGGDVWQGVAGMCNFDAIRCMIGGGTSNIISAASACLAFLTQCVLTGAAVALRPTYWGAVIDLSTCRIRHCGTVANPQQGIINFRSGNSIEFCTSPMVLTGAGVEGRVHGNPTFANNTNAAPVPNIINANGAIWRNGTGRPVDPTFQSMGVFNATLDFPSIAAGASHDLTIAAAGAVFNDYCVATRNNSGWPDQNVIYEAFVSAADVLTIRAHNVGTIARDPAAANIRVLVIRG